MGDPLQNYPATGPAFAPFTDTISTSKNDPDYCPKNYTFTVYPDGYSSTSFPLTNFSFDQVTR